MGPHTQPGASWAPTQLHQQLQGFWGPQPVQLDVVSIPNIKGYPCMQKHWHLVVLGLNE